MATPAPACSDVTLDETIAAIALAFPGGVTIVPPVTADVQTALAVSRASLGQLSSALAPLAPILNLIQFAQDMLGLAQAIPAAFGPPPNPAKIVEAIQKLIKDIDKLLGVLPPLSIPILVRSVLNVVIANLQGVQTQMRALIGVAETIASSQARSNLIRSLPNGAGVNAANSLDATLLCSRQSLSAQMSGMQQGMGTLGQLLGIINAFTKPLGLPVLGPPASFDLSDPSANLAPLDDAIAILKAVQQAIPL